VSIDTSTQDGNSRFPRSVVLTTWLLGALTAILAFAAVMIGSRPA